MEVNNHDIFECRCCRRQFTTLASQGRAESSIWLDGSGGGVLVFALEVPGSGVFPVDEQIARLTSKMDAARKQMARRQSVSSEDEDGGDDGEDWEHEDDEYVDDDEEDLMARRWVEENENPNGPDDNLSLYD